MAPDPADPDAYDLSVWNSVGPGIHSGFGSLDVSYPKSVPPKGPVANAIELHGWKGERVSCLLLVWSALNKENVMIRAGELRNGHFKIGKDRISISAVKYVLADEFDGCGANDLAVPAHIRPDLLSRTNHFPIGARESREASGEHGVVLLGRPYNIYDGGANLEIATKLREYYGANVIPFDFIDLDPGIVARFEADFYWSYGAKILAAAAFTRDRPNLHLIYLTNFNYGPDSFLLSYFRRLIGAKPFPNRI